MQQVLLSSVSDVSSSLLSLCPLLQNNPRHDKHDRNEIKMKLVPNDDTWTFVIFPVFKSCQVSANALLSSLPAFCINPASLSFCNRCMMSVSSSDNVCHASHYCAVLALYGKSDWDFFIGENCAFLLFFRLIRFVLGTVQASDS